MKTTVKKDWKNIFSHAKIDLTIHVSVDSGSLLFQPTFLEKKNGRKNYEGANNEWYVMALIINMLYAKSIGLTQGIMAREVKGDIWISTFFSIIQG